MISAGEFIDLLRVLSEAFKDVKQVTEEDLDRFTVAKAREECGKSVENSNLISVRPEDSLHLVALVLLKNNMYSVPVVSYGGVAAARTPAAARARSHRVVAVVVVAMVVGVILVITKIAITTTKWEIRTRTRRFFFT